MPTEGKYVRVILADCIIIYFYLPDQSPKKV